MKFMTHALEEARLGFGEKDPHVGAALVNLAEIHRNLKDFDKAEELCKEVQSLIYLLSTHASVRGSWLPSKLPHKLDSAHSRWNQRGVGFWVK